MVLHQITFQIELPWNVTFISTTLGLAIFQKFKREIFRRSLHYHGAVLWNALPSFVKNSTDEKAFKSNYYKHFKPTEWFVIKSFKIFLWVNVRCCFYPFCCPTVWCDVNNVNILSSNSHAVLIDYISDFWDFLDIPYTLYTYCWLLYLSII